MNLFRCCMILLLALTSYAQAAERPPARLMQALERGINLPIWFTYRGQPGIDAALWYPDAADWRQIKALGFQHVRVQFDPAYFRDAAKPGALQGERIKELKRALAPAWAMGLVVVMAAEPEAAEKRRLVGDDAGIAELAAFWRSFAKSLRGTGPKQLVFELLNEPTDTDAARNRVLMLKLVEAVRAVAPRHTLVVEGHAYSGIDELLAFEPLALPNLVYSFHFYEPHNFTHQGATWSWPMLTQFKYLPYPSSPETVAPLLEAASDDARPHIAWYGEQRWDRARIEARLDLVRDWAKAKDVALWCGEFGASRLASQPEARRAWLADVHSALEARGIAWSLFDYVGHFGLVSGTAGARQLDTLDAAALGLPEPGRPKAQ